MKCFFALISAMLAVTVPRMAFGQAVPQLRDAFVHTRVFGADASGIRTFEYEVSNGRASDGPIRSFNVSISRGSNTALLPVGGLTINFGATVEPLAGATDDFGMDGSQLVPTGCSGPPNWNCGLAVGGWIGFGVAVGKGIAPGDSGAGFTLRSPGLPGIVPARLEPYYFYVNEGEGTEEDVQAAKKAYQEIILPIKVVGPVAPPSSFKPLLFTQMIRDLIHQAQTLGWIRSDHVEDALERRLGRMEAALRDGRQREAVEAGRAFLDVLEDASLRRHDREAITSDADGLLSLNMEYLLAQLQDTDERDRNPRK
jgi:hypothetical protein